MGIRDTLTLRPLEVPTPSGRVWICERIGRAQLAALGILHLALGVGADEAARAAELVHLDADEREQLLEAASAGLVAEAGADRRVAGLAQTIHHYDRVAAAVVRACRPTADASAVPCRLVLSQTEATTPEQEARGEAERIWVGEAALLADLAAIAAAVELALLEDIRAGRSFRAAAPLGAGPR